MAVITAGGIATVKAVGAGSLGALLAMTLNDIEFMLLITTGILSASLSYFYDWVHRDPRHLGLKELSEFLKYILYGEAIMFIVYYLGINHGSTYLELPVTVWGFFASISSASAVVIVEWAGGMINKLALKKVK